MAAVPKVILRGTLASSANAVPVVVPQAKQWTITNLIVTNTSVTGTIFVTVRLDGVSLLESYPLAALAVLALDCRQVLDAGKPMLAFCSSATNVSIHCSGVEVDV